MEVVLKDVQMKLTELTTLFFLPECLMFPEKKGCGQSWVSVYAFTPVESHYLVA